MRIIIEGEYDTWVFYDVKYEEGGGILAARISDLLDVEKIPYDFAVADEFFDSITVVIILSI